MSICENITVTRSEDPTQLKISLTTKEQVFSFDITRDMGYLFLYELYSAVDLYGGAAHARTNN